MRQNLAALEMERNDYRKAIRELTPEKEEQRQKIIGWLYVNDPLWLVTQEIVAQISALATAASNHENGMSELEWRKEVFASLSTITQENIPSLSDRQVGDLRALIILKDKAGLDAWLANIQ